MKIQLLGLVCGAALAMLGNVAVAGNLTTGYTSQNLNNTVASGAVVSLEHRHHGRRGHKRK